MRVHSHLLLAKTSPDTPPAQRPCKRNLSVNTVCNFSKASHRHSTCGCERHCSASASTTAAESAAARDTAGERLDSGSASSRASPRAKGCQGSTPHSPCQVSSTAPPRHHSVSVSPRSLCSGHSPQYASAQTFKSPREEGSAAHAASTAARCSTAALRREISPGSGQAGLQRAQETCAKSTLCGTEATVLECHGPSVREESARHAADE